MRATAKLTSKGQVTIPAKMRKHFGLRSGDPLEFVEAGGVLQVVPAAREISMFERWRGIGNPGLPVGREVIVEYFRDLRGYDECD